MFVDNEFNLLQKNGSLSVCEKLHLKSKQLQRKLDVLFEVTVFYLQQIISEKFNNEIAPFSSDPYFNKYHSAASG